MRYFRNGPWGVYIKESALSRDSYCYQALTSADAVRSVGEVTFEIDDDYVFIRSISVDEASGMRGSGLGSLMIDLVCRKGLQNKVGMIRLDALAGAVGFYKRLGMYHLMPSSPISTDSMSMNGKLSTSWLTAFDKKIRGTTAGGFMTAGSRTIRSVISINSKWQFIPLKAIHRGVRP